MKTGSSFQTISSGSKSAIDKALKEKSLKTKDIDLLQEGIYVEYITQTGQRPLYKVLSFNRDSYGIYTKILIQKVDESGNLANNKFEAKMEKLHVVWIQPGDKIKFTDYNKRTKGLDEFEGTVEKMYYDVELNIYCEDSNGYGRIFMPTHFPQIEILP